MKAILIIIAALLLLFLFIRFLEYKSTYYPFTSIEYTPRDIGLDYEDLTFTTKDGTRISGWFIPSESSRAVIIFCHGNGGNISYRLEKIMMLNRLNLDVLIFDYRGFGMSEGRPSENGFYLDTEAVYEYMVNDRKVSPRSIIGYGESLGGAVIIDLASKQKLGGIIVESSFTSVPDMAKKVAPFIPGFVYKSRFDALSKIKDIDLPKLIFHSVNDEVVPFEHGERLFNNAGEPKKFVKMQGDHNDAFLVSKDLFMTEIDLFIGRL
ncbi:MAG: alpha/beta hydrolase [Nitrospirota bacterium]